MSASPSELKPSKAKLHKTELQVSAHDQVASLVVALLIVVGFFTTTMFLLWLTTRVHSGKIQGPVEYLEDLGEQGEDSLGEADDLEPPGVEELPDVEQPQLSDTLQAVTDVVSNQVAVLDALQGSSALMGKGSGLGDRRKRGTGSGGIRPERKINYITTSIEAYADQLDYFQIELGVLRRGSDTLDYASQFSAERPTNRTATKEEESRSFFLWTGANPLVDLDRKLLEKAGLQLGNGVIIQFWPKDSWQLLLHAEKDYAEAAGFARSSVRRTIYSVNAVKSGYEIVVTDQAYR